MKLHYKKIGEGKSFIILHGLFGSGDNLQTFARSLSSHGFAVFLVDLRNHGHSTHTDEHNYKVMGEDVAELITNEQLQTPIVFGHSMGGKVAMQLAIDHPGLLSKLIVVDMTPHSYPLQQQKIIDALKSVDLVQVHARGEVEKKLAEQIDDNVTRQFLLKNLYWKENNQLAWRFNLDVIAHDIEEMGKATESEIPVLLPTLFVKGERSDYIDPAKFQSFKKTFPNAELVIVPNSGHWVHADNPNGLLNAVIQFVS